MKVGDLVMRKRYKPKGAPHVLPADPVTGIVVGFDETPARNRDYEDKMIIVRWNDKQWTTDAWHHPDNLELVSESR